MVKIIECPRDAWQGLPKNMPAEVKADYLRVLIAAGVKHIDAVSFVSRAAVPQMADSELVLEYLDPPDDVEIIGIVVNAKGAERAVKTFLQTGIALGGGTQVVNLFSLDIGWGTVLQVSLSAAILSVVTSLISGLTPPQTSAGFFTPPPGRYH